MIGSRTPIKKNIIIPKGVVGLNVQKCMFMFYPIAAFGLFYLMKKDAFYFPHFSNARHDRKLKRVQKDLGIEGYGIYFMLLEVLREQMNFKYPLSDVDLLADEFNCSEVKIKTIISKYDLFNIDESSNFFSIKQVQYLQPYIDASARASDAARIRWGKAKEQLGVSDANAYANALPMHCDSNADAMQGEESKGEESKPNKNKEQTILNFEDFWNRYGKKNDKENSKKKFYKLSLSEQEKILSVVDLYVSKTPEVKYRKNPMTWLNGKCWEDDYSDIVKQTQESKPEPKLFYTNEDYEAALAKWNAKNATSNLHDIQGHLL